MRFCVQAGEPFRAGDPLYEIETEKVNNEIEANGDGTMVEHCVAEGDVVAVGDPVCIVEAG